MSSILGCFQGAYPNLYRHFNMCMFIYEVVNPFCCVGKNRNKTQNNLEDKSYCWWSTKQLCRWKETYYCYFTNTITLIKNYWITLNFFFPVKVIIFCQKIKVPIGCFWAILNLKEEIMLIIYCLFWRLQLRKRSWGWFGLIHN